MAGVILLLVTKSFDVARYLMGLGLALSAVSLITGKLMLAYRGSERRLGARVPAGLPVDGESVIEMQDI